MAYFSCSTFSIDNNCLMSLPKAPLKVAKGPLPQGKDVWPGVGECFMSKKVHCLFGVKFWNRAEGVEGHEGWTGPGVEDVLLVPHVKAFFN